MSNNINLKKGLNIPIKGAAKPVVKKRVVSGTIGILPDDFKGFLPRLLVKEGDCVLAGSPVMADKKNPDILITSPVSGTVKSIVRGEKRKLLEVLIETSEEQNYVDFGSCRPESLKGDEIRDLLLKSGLWAAIIQRPYGIIADPTVKPKAIFVSAFNTAPLAADLEFTLGGEFTDIQAGVTALSKLTDGGIHISPQNDNYSSTPFHKLDNAILHTFSGKHPAGNVGVQISHIAPIKKEETVWTVSLQLLASIGKLFTKGKLDLSRKVAVTGPSVIEPAYIETIPGASVSNLKSFYGASTEGLRFISGDVLSGKSVGAKGRLGFYDNQITIISEGTDTELFGWAKPFRFNQFSSTRSYFSWLLPNKEYDMDTNLHGGPRAFVMSDAYYSNVLPMDIYPLYLIKACLAGDIDSMEKFGIYEVIPEDLALCEYVDPSKNYIQDIIQKGIDLMIKEMA